MELYELYHIYELECGCDEVKKIGIFSSLALAEQALERAKSQPGFVDYPEGFEIYPTKLDCVCWTEGFVTMRGDQEIPFRHPSQLKKDLK